MLNKYTWELYLRSGGSKIVEFFKNQLSVQYTEMYADFVAELHKSYCPEKVATKLLRNELLELKETLDEGSWYLEDGEYSIESALGSIFEALHSEWVMTDQQAFGWFSDSIASITTHLAIEAPELFIPYYFKSNFNVLEIIAREFGILLPDIPVKRAYKNRFMFYAHVCDALWDFGTENGLSLYELCAFLYDFAPKYIGGIDSYIIKDVPNPIGAFFIGASHDDLFLADNEDEVCCWQCSPDTMPGDMIVMYMRSPDSKIDSVWRSVSAGFNDPFFYYYRCSYIAKPRKVKPIALETLQIDPVYRELPIVRKNMQGVNGVELMPTVYNRMANDFGVELPRLSGEDFAVASGCVNEKDVENQLIKPLLEKLRYTTDDYIQQMVMWIGNHNAKEIPDFVVLPNVTPRHQSACFLIEAKHTIVTRNQLEDAKQQARSYAKQLSTKYTVIASQEKLWVTADSDDYSESIFVATWAELSDPDRFRVLFSLLGNKR